MSSMTRQNQYKTITNHPKKEKLSMHVPHAYYKPVPNTKFKCQTVREVTSQLLLDKEI